MDKSNVLNDFPPNLLEAFQNNPIEDLVRGKSPFKGIPDVYEEIPLSNMDSTKPSLLIIIGPSGAGKDASMRKIIESGKGEHVITATTRKRRTDRNEPEDSYMWIDEPKLNGEDNEQYEERIANTYNLIEHNSHHGEVYGLPKVNLEKLKGRNIVGIIRTENNGLKVIKENLENEYNIVSVFITADSYEVLAKRIMSRNNYLVRMEKAPVEVKNAKNNVNFIVINPENPNGSEAGEEEIAEKLLNLFKNIFPRV